MHFKEEKEDFSKEELSELEAFLTIWTAAWMKKWQERVKLLVGKQSKKDFSGLQKTSDEVDAAWDTLEIKEELIDIAKNALISNGEICGTQILAENVLKMELAKDNVEFDNQGIVELLNNVMRRARVISQTSGPLMFVEINKAYYASVLNQSLT